jgi:hypothetical protein
MIRGHRTALAALAQVVYDKWDTDDGVGRCVMIARQWASYYAARGFTAAVVGVNDAHSCTWIAKDGDVVEADLPYQHYEYFARNRWLRIPGVTILPDWIIERPIQGDDRRLFLGRVIGCWR